MAQVAAGLGVEQFPAAFGQVADGVPVSGDEMIERRVERNERPLISGNGAQHVLLVHATTERLHELLVVVLITGNFGDGIADTGGAHFEGVRDRQRRLLLERIDSAVPKLRLVIERVQDGWRVALTDTAVDADRRGCAYRKSNLLAVDRESGDVAARCWICAD